MEQYTCSESIVIGADAERLYLMVSDITRMGEWSPVAGAWWWEADTGPIVGAWFAGRNDLEDRSFGSRCQVVAAEPARQFGFVVRELTIRGQQRPGPFVRWDYEFLQGETTTKVTESLRFLPECVSRFKRDHGPEEGHRQITTRVDGARTRIAETLAALKSAAEQTTSPGQTRL